MGLSPWQKEGELLLLKTGQKTERPANDAMERGKRLEPVARQAYVEHSGIGVEPLCVQSRQHAWMRASLDGLSADGHHVVEIKCPGEKDHSLAASGIVPGKYYPQLQHILAVTGLAEIFYWSFRFDHTVLLKVDRDEWLYRRADRKRGRLLDAGRGDFGRTGRGGRLSKRTTSPTAPGTIAPNKPVRTRSCAPGVS